jgi:hypothetical protein
MSYNRNTIITYPFYDAKLRRFLKDKFDLKDVNEFEDLSEFIYQNEFMNTFNLGSSNEHTPIDILTTLFGEIKLLNCHKMNDILKLLKEQYLCLNEDDAFVYLFSYDYFFLTHKCICDFLNEGEISKENLDNLERSIKSG